MLYHQEQEFKRYGLHISRQNMANWTIQCADRYLAVLYDHLHKKMYSYHVLQANATPVLVNRDGRPPGAKVICGYTAPDGCTQTAGSCCMNTSGHVMPATRGFLKNFSGICVTDGYQVYHTIEAEREDMRIAGCWSYARRRFDEAVKTLPKAKQKDSRAYLALTMIQAIYREEKQLKDPSRTRETEPPPIECQASGGGLFHIGA